MRIGPSVKYSLRCRKFTQESIHPKNLQIKKDHAASWQWDEKQPLRGRSRDDVEWKTSRELSLSEKENDKSDKFQRVWEQRIEVEKRNRINLPSSSETPFKVISFKSLSSPSKKKRGNPCPRLLLTRNRCLLTEVRLRAQGSGFSEPIARGPCLTAQAPWGLFFNIKHILKYLNMISWAIMSKIKSTHSTHRYRHTYAETCTHAHTHTQMHNKE